MHGQSYPDAPLVLVLAKSVQDRLGPNFYSFLDVYPLSLEHGLFTQFRVQLDFVDNLDNMGFVRGVDYGVGYPGTSQFVPCTGIWYEPSYSVPARAADPWTEDNLPQAVRSARERVHLARRHAEKILKQAELEAACELAASEGIPAPLVAWARRQPHALSELNELRQSVLRLRAVGVEELRIASALGSEHFLQELFTLKRDAHLRERPLPGGKLTPSSAS